MKQFYSRLGVALVAVLLIVVAFSRPTLAGCPWYDLGCHARKAGKDVNREFIKGTHDLDTGTRQIFKQARKDLSNGADRIDPRITQFGRDFDGWRREFVAAVIGGPTLEAWIRQSRNDASDGSIPIPKNVRQAMQGWYTEQILNTVGYKIGDNGEVNVAHDSITYGDAVAVTLIDIIVFKNADVANDMSIWAHELHHVTQFNDWGVHSFAVQYVRNSNTVENPAYEIQKRYAAAYDRETNTALVGKVPPPEVPRKPILDKDRPPIILKMTQVTSLEAAEVGGGLAAEYGADILHNAPDYGVEKANAANFNFDVAKGGKYLLSIEFAAAKDRPVTIILNGKNVATLSGVTGGWYPIHQTWQELVVVDLNIGKNILRLWSEKSVFPHIRTIAFMPT